MMSTPNMIIRKGQNTPQKFTMMPLASSSDATPTSTIIMPKIKPTIMPPLGKPKHSSSIFL